MSSSYHQGHVEHSLRGLAYLSRPAPDPGPTHLIPGETRAQGGSTNVATSRTGTAKWQAIVRRRRATAQSEGIVACPICRRQLDYVSKRGPIYNPSLVEVDHIVTAERGGRDEYENTRVLCSDCNKKRRGRERLARMVTVKDPIVTSQAW